MSTIETVDITSKGLGRLKDWLGVAGGAAILLGVIGILFPFVVTLATALLFGGLLAALGLLLGVELLLLCISDIALAIGLARFGAE